MMSEIERVWMPVIAGDARGSVVTCDGDTVSIEITSNSSGLRHALAEVADAADELIEVWRLRDQHPEKCWAAREIAGAGV